jgi:hypothetical protein
MGAANALAVNLAWRVKGGRAILGNPTVLGLQRMGSLKQSLEAGQNTKSIHCLVVVEKGSKWTR